MRHWREEAVGKPAPKRAPPCAGGFDGSPLYDTSDRSIIENVAARRLSSPTASSARSRRNTLDDVITAITGVSDKDTLLRHQQWPRATAEIVGGTEQLLPHSLPHPFSLASNTGLQHNGHLSPLADIGRGRGGNAAAVYHKGAFVEDLSCLAASSSSIDGLIATVRTRLRADIDARRNFIRRATERNGEQLMVDSGARLLAHPRFQLRGSGEENTELGFSKAGQSLDVALPLAPRHFREARSRSKHERRVAHCGCGDRRIGRSVSPGLLGGADGGDTWEGQDVRVVRFDGREPNGETEEEDVRCRTPSLLATPRRLSSGDADGDIHSSLLASGNATDASVAVANSSNDFLDTCEGDCDGVFAEERETLDSIGGFDERPADGGCTGGSNDENCRFWRCQLGESPRPHNFRLLDRNPSRLVVGGRHSLPLTSGVVREEGERDSSPICCSIGGVGAVGTCASVPARYAKSPKPYFVDTPGEKVEKESSGALCRRKVSSSVLEQIEGEEPCVRHLQKNGVDGVVAGSTTETGVSLSSSSTPLGSPRVVVISVEMSGRAWRLVRWARRHVLQPGDWVVLVTAWKEASQQTDRNVPGMILITRDDIARFNLNAVAKCSSRLRQLTETFLADCRVYPVILPVQKKTKTTIGAVLCRVASELHADHLIVGSHGHTHIRQLLFGSVSRYIQNHSPCPVATARA